MTQRGWKKTIASLVSCCLMGGLFTVPFVGAAWGNDAEVKTQEEIMAQARDEHQHQANIDDKGRIQDETVTESVPDDIAPQTSLTDDEVSKRADDAFTDTPYEPVQAEPLPNEKYSHIPIIGKGLNNLTSNNTNVGHMDFDASQDDPEGDGTTIEKIVVKWLNTNDSRYTLTTSSNAPRTFGARVDFSLSGEKSYLPGDVEIVMPLNIFTDRFGEDEGAVDVSLPQDPAQGTTFTYKRIDDTIVASNTAEIPAGYQGYFEVYWDKVVPAEVVSGSVSAPFGAKISVMTRNGNELRRTSSTIDAVINTRAAVTRATKVGTPYRSFEALGKPFVEAGTSIDADNTMSYPDGFNTNDYYYVDWTVSAVVEGNQYFDLSSTDVSFSGPGKVIDEHGDEREINFVKGDIIGTSKKGCTISEDRQSVSCGKVFSGFSNGTAGSYHVYIAYPRDQFDLMSGVVDLGPVLFDPSNPNGSNKDPVSIGSVRNTVEYTLTEWDTKRVSHAKVQADTTFREYPISKPTGHFMVHKWGTDAYSNWPTGYDQHLYREYGVHTGWVNKLAKGENLPLQYRVSTDNFPYPWTYGCDEDDHDISSSQAGNKDDENYNPELITTKCSPTDTKNYNKRFVDVTTVDDAAYFNELTPTDPPMTADEYEFTGLKIGDSLMYEYYSKSAVNGELTASDGAYRITDKVARPDIEFYAKTDGGDWVHYGTASWGKDGLGSVTVTPDNGASVTGPEYQQAWPEADPRVQIDAGTAGHQYYMMNMPTLVFPQGARITQWKMDYSTNAAGIYTSVWPQMTLKATDGAVAVAKKLVEQAQGGEIDIRNDVHMDVTQVNNGIRDHLVHLEKLGINRITSILSHASMSKRVDVAEQSEQDRINRSVRLVYSINASNSVNASGQMLDDAIDEGLVTPDYKGAFYDLLPLNMRVDEASIKVSEDLESIEFVPDWRGSGRTMLIAKFTNKQGFGTRSMSFNATYTWQDMKDVASYFTNNVAYVSRDAKQIGTVLGYRSEPDDPNAGQYYGSKDATRGVEDLMAGLTDDPNDSTLYASAYASLSARMYALAGLSKDVCDDASGKCGMGLDLIGGHVNPALSITVPVGGTYQYRMRIENDGGQRLKDIVLYDDLEGYKPTEDKQDYGLAQWEGSFLSVNLEPLKRIGVAPKVYYALQHVDLTKWKITGDNESLNEGRIEGHPDLSDTSVWTDTLPDDPSQVKAIAIDCSKRADGSDFVLQPLQSMHALVRMRAPDNDEAQGYIRRNAHAYNNIYMSSTNTTILDRPVDQYIHQDYTKIGLVPFDITVHKSWNDGDNRDGKRAGSIAVQLMRDGVAYGQTVTLSEANGWSHTFKSMAKTDEQGRAIIWSVKEIDVPDGYTFTSSLDYTTSGLTINGVNRHEPERIDLGGTKTWADETNSTTRPKSVTVNLYADGVKQTSKEVVPDDNGNWTYSFTNLYKYVRQNDQSREIKYTVDEEYTEGYVPRVADNGIDIVNHYYPYGDITLSKSASNTTEQSKDTVFMFKLTLLKPTGTNDDNGDEIYDTDTGIYAWERSDGAKGTVRSGDTVSLKAGQTVTVKRVPSRDKYLFEEMDADGFTAGENSGLSGVVTSGGKHDAVIDNVYATQGSVNLQAKKRLTGRDLANRQFRFEVYSTQRVDNTDGVKQGTLLRTAYNNVEGIAKFSSIGYSTRDANSTYVYLMREADQGRVGYTYDTAVYWVEVQTIDNGDGTLTCIPTYWQAQRVEGVDGAAGIYQRGDKIDVDGSNVPVFVNEYHASGTVKLNVTKTYAGGDLKGKSFEFTLTDKNSGKTIDTAETNGTDTASFATLQYTEKDAGKTFVYEVAETKTDDKETVFDEHKETVTVKVSDLGNGALDIEQTFEGGDPDAPLVWRNIAADGSLKLVKKISDDAQTREHKDTVFPMQVSVSTPKGGREYTGTHTATVFTPIWPEDGSWPQDTDALEYSESTVEFTVSDHGTFTIGVPACGYAVIDGLPGGTSYLVTEVASLDD